MMTKIRPSGMIHELYAAIVISLYLANIPTPLASEARIDSLVQEALSTNPEIVFYQAEIDGARARRRDAGRLSLPTVSSTFGTKQIATTPSQLGAEGTAWSVTISQKFEWPGRLRLRKAIANEEIALAELGLREFRSALSNEIRSHAFSYAATKRIAAIAQLVSDRYRALRQILIQRDAAGITPKLALRILEAAELALRRRTSVATSTATEARLYLNHLLGRPLRESLELQLEPVNIVSPPPLSELIATATTNSFTLQHQIAEIRKQGFQVSLAKNLQWPSFSIGPWINEETGGGKERIAGLALSFPLPLWRNNRANIESENARLRQAQSLLTAKQREIERELTAAILKLQAKQSELKHWHENSINEFSEAAALADQHYRLGAVSATTYVDMQQQYLDAVETLLDTVNEAIEAAATIEQITQIRLLH